MKKIIGLAKKNITPVKILSAEFLSSLGTGFTFLAVPLAMLKLEEGNKWFASATIFASVLLFFLSPFIGKMIDKYSKKNIIVFNTSILSVLVFTISLFTENTNYLLILLALLHVLSASYYAVQVPTRLKFIYDSIGPEKFEKFNRIFEVQAQAVSVLGGAIGAVVLTVFDVSMVLKIDALTYLISFFLYLTIRPLRAEEKKEKTNQSLKKIESRSEAVDFLKNQPLVFLFLFITFLPFIGVIVGNYLWPVHILNTLNLGATALGLKSTVYGAGAITGGVIVGKVIEKYGNFSTMNIMYFVYFISVLAAAFTRNLFLFLVLQAFIGIGNSSTKIIRNTMLMKMIPGQLYGRVNSVFFSLRFLIQTLLVVGMSLLVEMIGTEVAFVAFLAIVLMGFVFLIGVKKDRLIQEEKPPVMA